jgi:RimJ/RimL family protein N-acetyltransferase
MAGSSPPARTIVRTERLRLREQDPGDIEFFADMLGDPKTLVHWPRPLTREEAERWISQNQRRYAEDGFGWWAVELLETGELLGDCGLSRYTLDGEPEVELGYHFHRRYWGNGYATEAAQASVEIAVERGLSRLIALILPANTASQGVARRVGFSPGREIVHANMPHVVWGRSLP